MVGLIFIFIPYVLIGLLFLLVNNVLSKRKFLKNFDPKLKEPKRRHQWDKSKYIYGEDWPISFVILLWPLLLVAVVGNSSHTLFKNKTKNSYKNAVDQYYNKYPEKKL